MTMPLNHAQTYMRLVSSQLAIPTVEFCSADISPIAAALALRHYETARRAAIAFGRRQRFHVVQASDPCNMIDTKRGFGRRASEEFERGY